MDDIRSRPYLDANACCELCCFGTGKHAEWCEMLKVADQFVKALSDIHEENTCN